jgi:hypothetical protein
MCVHVSVCCVAPRPEPLCRPRVPQAALHGRCVSSLGAVTIFEVITPGHATYVQQGHADDVQQGHGQQGHATYVQQGTQPCAHQPGLKPDCPRAQPVWS